MATSSSVKRTAAVNKAMRTNNYQKAKALGISLRESSRLSDSQLRKRFEEIYDRGDNLPKPEPKFFGEVEGMKSRTLTEKELLTGRLDPRRKVKEKLESQKQLKEQQAVERRREEFKTAQRKVQSGEALTSADVLRLQAGKDKFAAIGYKDQKEQVETFLKEREAFLKAPEPVKAVASDPVLSMLDPEGKKQSEFLTKLKTDVKEPEGAKKAGVYSLTEKEKDLAKTLSPKIRKEYIEKLKQIEAEREKEGLVSKVPGTEISQLDFFKVSSVYRTEGKKRAAYLESSAKESKELRKEGKELPLGTQAAQLGQLGKFLPLKAAEEALDVAGLAQYGTEYTAKYGVDIGKKIAIGEFSPKEEVTKFATTAAVVAPKLKEGLKREVTQYPITTGVDIVDIAAGAGELVEGVVKRGAKAIPSDVIIPLKERKIVGKVEFESIKQPASIETIGGKFDVRQNIPTPESPTFTKLKFEEKISPFKTQEVEIAFGDKTVTEVVSTGKKVSVKTIPKPKDVDVLELGSPADVKVKETRKIAEGEAIQRVEKRTTFEAEPVLFGGKKFQLDLQKFETIKQTDIAAPFVARERTSLLFEEPTILQRTTKDPKKFLEEFEIPVFEEKGLIESKDALGLAKKREPEKGIEIFVDPRTQEFGVTPTELLRHEATHAAFDFPESPFSQKGLSDRFKEFRATRYEKTFGLPLKPKEINLKKIGVITEKPLEFGVSKLQFGEEAAPSFRELIRTQPGPRKDLEVSTIITEAAPGVTRQEFFGIQTGEFSPFVTQRTLFPKGKKAQVSLLDLDLRPRQRVTPISKTDDFINKLEIDLPATKVSAKLDPGLGIRALGVTSALSPSLISDIKPLQDVKPVQDIKPIQDVKPLQDVKPVQDIKPIQDVKPIKPIPGGFKTPDPIKRLKKINLEFKEAKTKKEQGYNVLVKSKGKFVRANEVPLSYGDAVSRGAYVTDNSAAVTYKVIKSKKSAQTPETPTSSFARSKFRGRKIKGKEVKQPNTYLEKNKHRIDSRGELEGITAKGLITNDRLRAKKRMQRAVSSKNITGGKTLKLQPTPKMKRNVGTGKLKAQRLKL